MEQKKKITAAIAAVTHYIKSEQEAQIAAQPAAMPPSRKIPVAGSWTISGRQSQMQLRNLMQMKSFHGARLR